MNPPVTREEKMDIAREMLQDNPDVTNAEIDDALVELCGERLHPEFTALVRRQLGIYKRGRRLFVPPGAAPTEPAVPKPPKREVIVEVSRKAFEEQLKILQATMKAQDITQILITPDGIKIARVTWDSL